MLDISETWYIIIFQVYIYICFPIKDYPIPTHPHRYQGAPHMKIGRHHLLGKVETMSEPLAVMKKIYVPRASEGGRYAYESEPPESTQAMWLMGVGFIRMGGL